MQPLAYQIKQILNRLNNIENNQKKVVVIDNLFGSTKKQYTFEVKSSGSTIVILPGGAYFFGFRREASADIYNLETEETIVSNGKTKEYTLEKTETNKYTNYY